MTSASCQARERTRMRVPPQLFSASEITCSSSLSRRNNVEQRRGTRKSGTLDGIRQQLLPSQFAPMSPRVAAHPARTANGRRTVNPQATGSGIELPKLQEPSGALLGDLA